MGKREMERKPAPLYPLSPSPSSSSSLPLPLSFTDEYPKGIPLSPSTISTMDATSAAHKAITFDEVCMCVCLGEDKGKFVCVCVCVRERKSQERGRGDRRKS